MPYVLRGVFEENGLDLEFYKEAIKRFDDDEAIPTLFTDVMVKISSQLATKSMEDDYKPYVNVSFTKDRSSDARTDQEGFTNVCKVPSSSQQPGATPYFCHGSVRPWHRKAHIPRTLLPNIASAA